MSVFVIGDLQGCHQSCVDLLAQIEAIDPGAQLWFAGDLINRGPDSLATLRLVKSLGQRARCVLGNHDLHLLAVSQGIRKSSRSDTLDDILQAPDRNDLIDWLRQQPLAIYEQGHLLVHAGVLPQWSAVQTRALASEVETVLRGEDWADFLRQMYGNEPDQWQDHLQGAARLRCIVNGLTRLRFCDQQGVMEFASKEGAGGAPQGFVPWFDVRGRKTQDTTVVFGHWSTLGLLLRDNLIALDSGCVWGGKLSAVRLDDRKLVEVSCPEYQKPGTIG
ncbi:MAG: hypothetical protein RL748_2623 [Pseudomonadota bacterium]